MVETYDITYDGAGVGSAQMEKQGLYYNFSCRCRLPDQAIYRIHVICGGNREDLGICVPMGDMFGMDKKLAAKKLGEGTPTFELRPKDWEPRPVATEQKVMPEEITPEEDTLSEKALLPETESTLPEPEEQNLTRMEEQERFVPVSEEEPFDYLDKLENARMDIRDDVPGIILPVEEDV